MAGASQAEEGAGGAKGTMRMSVTPRRTKPALSIAVAACLSLCTMLWACVRSKDAAAGSKEAAASEVGASPSVQPSTNSSPTSAEPVPAAIFDSARAMQYVKEIVAFGPRPIGSANHRKVEDYLHSHLKSDEVEDDTFTIDTTEGKFSVHNIIAKYPGTKDGIIVIASHYDTNYPLRDTAYVGANDGASSSALLLEIANQLRGQKRDGYSVWLLWDDAEEAMKLPWTDANSVYGVRHLAEKWRDDGTSKKIKAFLLEDMIGDADLNIEHEQNSTPWLEDIIHKAATRMGYQSHFFARTIPMEDDHIPFTKMGVPSADLIDFDYGYENVFWHTTQDTVDKLSPKSLEIVGTVTLETVQMLDKK
jgi:peptidase M28-like protein